jgi:hypothetical protein
MEIRLYRTTEDTVRALGTAIQKLQWNCKYTELPKIRVRVLETAFRNLQWNYVYIEIPNVQCELQKVPFRNINGATST